MSLLQEVMRVTAYPHQAQGSEAKPTRSEKVEVELIFDFQHGKKPQVYPLRYTEDFLRAENRRATQGTRS